MEPCEAPVGLFGIEDSFTITGRGLVLAGQLLAGRVVSGAHLVFEDKTRWKIRGVNFMNHANSTESFGLLVDAPGVSHQELLDVGIIGAKVLIFA